MDPVDEEDKTDGVTIRYTPGGVQDMVGHNQGTYTEPEEKAKPERTDSIAVMSAITKSDGYNKQLVQVVVGVLLLAVFMLFAHNGVLKDKIKALNEDIKELESDVKMYKNLVSTYDTGSSSSGSKSSIQMPNDKKNAAFDEFNAWAAVDAYGKVSYPYGFELSMSKFEASKNSAGQWVVKADAKITNAMGATRSAKVNARVKPDGDGFQMDYFTVD